jgi:phosphoglycerate kinase
MKKLTLKDINVEAKRVVMRVDFNVPLDRSGEITDDTRIRASLESIGHVAEKAGRLVLLSHLGRPKGKVDPGLSLRPVADRLGELVDFPVKFVEATTGEEAREKVDGLQPGEILLLENLRFQPEEEGNDPAFAQTLASYGDLFVNDAFGSAHRAHASTEGITHYMDVCAAGFLMERELEYLGGLLDRPERPFVAVLGGAKVGTKLGVIEHLLTRVDTLLVGGGMAFTFFKALGLEVGRSLVNDELLEGVRPVLRRAKQGPSQLLLPVDTLIASEVSENAETREVPVTDILEEWTGVDIGRKTAKLFSDVILAAKTVVWNGPMGIFETPRFAEGTKAVARAIVESTDQGATSVIGGGDSAAAVNRMGLARRFSHVSTGGGASLELLEGKELPGVAALTDASEATCDA